MSEEEKPIVIVGGGICGLATALALHRKGIRSKVLEKAETLRTEGGGIGLHPNAWRALDQLGVGHHLRLKAIPLLMVRDIILSNGTQREESFRNTEFRCLKRSDLIETMAENLPSGTIRFGCQIVKMESDPINSSHTILHLQDGTIIKAKVVIGCDGVNSVVGDRLELKPTKRFNLCGVGGLTNYPNGHGFSNEFLRIRGNHMLVGRLPIDDKLVYWFVARPRTPQDTMISKEPKLFRDSTMELIKDYPEGFPELIKKCDLDSLKFNSLRHRAPWDILLESFRKGTVTVAGDAMHVMGPFIGQGGAAALEDAIVLGRCFEQEMAVKPMVAAGLDSERSSKNNWDKKKQEEEEKVMSKKFEKAIDRYVKERKMRILRLATQTYLIGTLLQTTSPVTKFLSSILLFIFFVTVANHTLYDCGRL
ncbi:monooxygenase 1-like [Telopea speciosissima]|uniref:monooxygenase 1-like n=1 Tax=Telopea speciosissima TaxID=54955 RepID=UPI001CC36C58|nr:monooxygenase 1-like [Telopea speciosissima]